MDYKNLIYDAFFHLGVNLISISVAGFIMIGTQRYFNRK